MSIGEFTGHATAWASGFASGYHLGYVEGIEVLGGRARSLVGAIGDALEADATLATLLAAGSGDIGLPDGMAFASGYASGHASGFLIGSDPDQAAAQGRKKVWHQLAPSRIPLPVLAYRLDREPRVRVARNTYTTQGQLQVTAQARTWPEADALAQRAGLVLRQGDANRAITWAGGRLMDLWDLDSSSPTDPRPAPAEGRLWEATRVYGCKFQGDHAA